MQADRRRQFFLSFFVFLFNAPIDDDDAEISSSFRDLLSRCGPNVSDVDEAMCDDRVEGRVPHLLEVALDVSHSDEGEKGEGNKV